MHFESPWIASTKWRNCGGRYRSDSRKCLAHHTRTVAPTKEQLNVFRQAGERKYQTDIRAKLAEEKAKSEKTVADDLINT